MLRSTRPEADDLFPGVPAQAALDAIGEMWLAFQSGPAAFWRSRRDISDG